MITENLLTTHIGAEIEGIDLRSSDLATHADFLIDALARHQVVFFRDQHLNLEQQKSLTRVFGPLSKLSYVEPLDGEPYVIRVLKEADEVGGTFGGDWHTDFSFVEHPPAGSVLSAVEIPPVGGDTLWTSQATAWDALPDDLKDLLLGRDAIHVGKPYGAKWSPPEETRSGYSIKMVRGDPAADQEQKHPAVLRNPITGRHMLFLNPTYVSRLDGMSEEESTPILNRIQAHATRPEFCCRFRWSAGTVAIWDNMATQHFAVNDYSGHRRLMYRTTFSGPVPTHMAAT
ncbi:MAG: taurine dioxygenase [Rhodospirillales bacterium]|jgi:taurine dioxygenase|nr:taurine dioxygenase [Rhodospirillales bacterium]MBT4039671.1 taurine dioxygenase [Rhodospirillales bacterium]MBT4626449.1 taurine dioxygenase [Rhodospirillales bacterium]MBT5350868.1 taurine dioxygenase [Rhodospirillales bacterium]MBT5520693.1 taurine dioxygenase [Rhodospirillales bacterium]